MYVFLISVALSVEEKEELNRLVRKQSISQSIAKRARLILLVAEEKLQHIEISKKVGIVQSPAILILPKKLPLY